ncbi:MAG: hypothetical protein WB510_13650 [Candidatus Sulfotelmatobacter sp.]
MLALGMVVALAPLVLAQEDGSDVPLGDVARSLRRKPTAEQEVIDNDNLSQVMKEAESQHLSGASLLFSLDPGGKSFHVSTPDVTCSLSFNANASSLLADPLALDELPRSEMMKLDGPASIDGDTLQVTVHNATQWDLREVVIGLTIVRRPDVDASSSYGSARIVPAVASGRNPQLEDSNEKRPDVTILFHIKGSAAPSSTAVFRTSLNFALFPDQEWHWAIVRAKGIPPQSATVPSAAQPVPGAQLPLPVTDRTPLPGPQVIPPSPNQSTPLPDPQQHDGRPSAPHTADKTTASPR